MNASTDTFLNVIPNALKGVRVLTLALNLPGPAAVMRLKAMGAQCTKLEPLAPAGSPAGLPTDPMGQYKPAAYATLHKGVKVVQADLKSAAGQKKLHQILARTDVLITSFRPSALRKLGVDGASLLKQYPGLVMVAIVGAPGARAEEPGHDLTYMADQGLVSGLALPPSLFADMGGSLLTSEAVLQALLLRQRPGRASGKGHYMEIALSDAAGYLGLPHQWGLTTADGSVGGAHAGYQVYRCKDGRVAVAALEPHFAARLCEAAGIKGEATRKLMHAPKTHEAMASFFAQHTRRQLDKLAADKDLPFHTLK